MPEKKEVNVEQEKIRLEQNLTELGDNLEEVESSSPSRKEKIRLFIREHQLALCAALVSMSAGVGSGSLDDFIFKTGIVTAMGIIGDTIVNKKKEQK